MVTPKGFIKDSKGVYRRGNYVYENERILKASDYTKALKESEEQVFLSPEECIRSIVEYSSTLGQALNTVVYVNETKDGYVKSDKETDKTVAIITPDNNVFTLYTEPVTEQTDTDTLKNEENAEAPKEQEPETKPKDQEDLKETDLKETSTDLIKLREDIKQAGELEDIRNLVLKVEDPELKKDLLNSIDSEDAKSYGPVTAYKSAVFNVCNIIDDYISDLNEADEDTAEETTEETSIEDNSTMFIRRPENLQDLQSKIAKHLVTPATYHVDKEITLTEEDFNNYCENLRQDTEFLAEFNPTQSDADFTCIAVKGPNMTLLIDNSGYKSAQYVGIA